MQWKQAAKHHTCILPILRMKNGSTNIDNFNSKEINPTERKEIHFAEKKQLLEMISFQGNTCLTSLKD